MRVSINDVARVAGVSKSTVSRALGEGSVSDTVRERVLAAVRATGYRPNMAARRLRSQHTDVLGVIVADIRNPFFTALIHVVEKAAHEAGMRLTLCNTDEDPEREAECLELMQDERIAGLILAPTRGTVGRASRLALDCPVVLIDRTVPGSRHDAVVLDNQAAMAELVEHLWEQGHRRIGGLFGSTSTTAAERRDGYLTAMQNHGLEAAYREVAPTVDAAIAEVDHWLRQPDRPDALVASNSLLLMGALKAARSAGLRIPQDLALAGFDNERWTELVEPGITVMEQPVEDMGRAAMALLLERIETPHLPVRRLTMHGRCLPRESTAPRGTGAA